MLFEHEIDKKMDHDFPKVRLKGQRPFGIFSQNSSVLVASHVSYAVKRGKRTCQV